MVFKIMYHLFNWVNIVVIKTNLKNNLSCQMKYMTNKPKSRNINKTFIPKTNFSKFKNIQVVKTEKKNMTLIICRNRIPEKGDPLLVTPLSLAKKVSSWTTWYAGRSPLGNESTWSAENEVYRWATVMQNGAILLVVEFLVEQ